MSAAETAARRGAGGRPDWAALRRGLDGALLLPGDAGYDDGRVLFSRQFDDVHPQAVAVCRTAQDVGEALDFARRHGLPAVPRGGRHSFGGYSTTPGLVIDTAGLDGVRHRDGLVEVGAGVRVIGLYRHLLPDGVLVPTGWCPTVGVAGLTLGGGFGLEGRQHGLTVDRLRAAEVRLADGSRVRCDADRHPDLFWALRGGGGGNFGVVTSLTFEPVPAPPRMVSFFSVWPWDRAADVVDAWQHWAATAPEVATPLLTLRRRASGEEPGQEGEPAPAVEVYGSWSGPPDQLTRELDALADRVGVQPSHREVADETYRDGLWRWFGCTDLTDDEAAARGQTPEGRIPRFGRSATRGSLFDRPAPRAGVEELVRAFASGPAGRETRELNLMALGGAVNRVPAHATAYVHRTALFSAGFTYVLDEPEQGGAERGAERRNDEPRSVGWLDGCFRTLRRWSTPHAYQNFVDPRLTDWRNAYYGDNYARLSRIRKRYDPEHFFRFPQGIT